MSLDVITVYLTVIAVGAVILLGVIMPVINYF
jgi:hypothetical protein